MGRNCPLALCRVSRTACYRVHDFNRQGREVGTMPRRGCTFQVKLSLAASDERRFLHFLMFERKMHVSFAPKGGRD